jgi:RNA polymerase sigma factor (TIGR02999 family)
MTLLASDATDEHRYRQVYEDMRRLARRLRSTGDGDTLSTTALVHETWLSMQRSHADDFASPAAFFAYAARAMRSILVDHARDRMRLKAGGDLKRVDLTEGIADIATAGAAQAIELDAALQRLAAENPRAAQVVELHFFAGLGLERIGELLALSTRTVDRDWRFARAFLHDALRG